jgi:glutaredoxin
MPGKIVVYGADWCGDTQRTISHLDSLGLEYQYDNIDEDPDGEQIVLEANGGKRKIPVVVVGETQLIAPSTSELDHQLSRTAAGNQSEDTAA